MKPIILEEEINLCLVCHEKVPNDSTTLCKQCIGFADEPADEAPMDTTMVDCAPIQTNDMTMVDCAPLQSTLSQFFDNFVKAPVKQIISTVKKSSKAIWWGKRKKFSGGNDMPDEEVKKECPFYRRVPMTSIIVDDFRRVYSNPAKPIFFLSHFHSDHYGGLRSTFHRGPIYCSEITARLVISRLRVNPRYIHPLPNNTQLEVEGVKVTLLDANHCPGSVMFLFQLPNGTYHLHTGDFRYDASLPDHEYIAFLNIENLYLDTTYCSPTYTFPKQIQVIEKCLEIISPAIQKPEAIILVGSYTIGKERLYISAAKNFNCKIYVQPDKYAIITKLNYPTEIINLFTTKQNQAKIHVVPLGDLNFTKITEYMKRLGWPINQAIAIKPTGWTFSEGKQKKNPNNYPKYTNKEGNIHIWGLPYSEHSSFTELKDFVKKVKPKNIISTVPSKDINEKVNLLLNQ